MLCLHTFGLGAVSVDCICLLYCPWSSGVVTTLFLLNTMLMHHDLEKNEQKQNDKVLGFNLTMN
jgi:hypothetical protein